MHRNEFNKTNKINNSYESEPSSGSGSSLSEPNDYSNFIDYDNMNFPYILKPPSYNNEVTIVTTTLPTPSSCNTNDSFEEKILEKNNSKSMLPVLSSEESPFEGFSDNSFGKIKQEMYADISKNIRVVHRNPTETSPVLFPRFYDAIVGENSCNAVDIQLSNELADSLKNTVYNKEAKDASNDTNQSLELSFNGKIKGLTTVTVDINTVDSTQQRSTADFTHSTELDTSLYTSQLNQSYILKKYSNEKSPDLFGDDDDDDDNDEDNDESNNAKNEHTNCNIVNTDELTIDQPITTTSSFREEIQSKDNLDTSINKSLNCPTESSFADDPTLDESTQIDTNIKALFRNNCKCEKELLARIRKCLAGLPPPPSVTIPQLDMFTAVLSKKNEILNFFTESVTEKECNSNTVNNLFKPTHTLEEAKSIVWRDILGVRHHGLSYNLSKASESNEYLSLSVIDRFIGAETASSYRHSPSSAKKRNLRMKLLTQSPGNRLSHLAKRRAIFSSANLATTSQKSHNSLGPQIIIDKNKTKNKRKGEPKRMTPSGKNKYRKTPTSSARKRIYRDLMKPIPSRETSKRALFQSPAKNFVPKNITHKPPIKPEIATRVEKSKRALFSPEKITDNSKMNVIPDSLKSTHFNNTQFETVLKRKRIDDDDAIDTMEFATHNSKLFRSSGENLTPRALKIKSQSFCIGAGSSFNISTAASTLTSNSSAANDKPSTTSYASNGGALTGGKMHRAHSDMVVPNNNLTENQRKKLLWAVSQALQEKKITAQHESFKQFASVLARVVRRIFQEFYQKTSTSNSETLLRLAKKYVYNVVSGKTSDDIYFQAKAQIDENKRLSCTRLSGYIGPEEYQKRKSIQPTRNGSIQNLFSVESSIDSYNFSQTSSSFCGQSIITSQSSLLGTTSQEDVFLSENSNMFNKIATKLQSQPSQQYQQSQQTQQLPIQPNPALQNSSSKSNFGGLALRENVDCELRRSAQKNFTGKDQRNVSPYADSNSSSTTRVNSAKKTQSQFLTDLNASGAKAKRQIIFDL